MTESEAEKLSIALMQVVALLDQTAAFVRDKDSKENWEKYRVAAGKAMGEVYLELESPLWKRFPNIKPTDMGGPYEVKPSIYEPKFYDSSEKDS